MNSWFLREEPISSTSSGVGELRVKTLCWRARGVIFQKLELEEGRGETHTIADMATLPRHGDAWGEDIGDRIEGTWCDTSRAQCRQALIVLGKGRH